MLHWGDHGPEVVLVHGAGLGAETWRRFGSGLAKRGFRVVAPNLCGYGDTPVPDDFATADDVAVLSALCGPDTVVLGHSYGGAVALRMALKQPVGRLVLYEPAAFDLLSDEESEATAQLGSDPSFWDLETGGDERWLRRFVDFWTEAGGWDALPEKARAHQIRYGRRAFDDVRNVHLDPTTVSDYAVIQTPTTLAWGSETRRDAKNIAAKLAAVIPGARTVEVPGAGHMGPLTHPREVMALLR